jgi:hypothetical protein
LFSSGGASRSRTGLHGFAGRCITALLSRRKRTVDTSRTRCVHYDLTDCAVATSANQTKREALLPHVSGAGDESRTRDLNLGKVALYQLSYSRVLLTGPALILLVLPGRSAPPNFSTLHRESGAGDESRTRDLNLGKVALYQLSYSRVFASAFNSLLPHSVALKNARIGEVRLCIRHRIVSSPSGELFARTANAHDGCTTGCYRLPRSRICGHASFM